MISQENINLIHKYLEDDLDREDIPLFKNQFENNPEFAAEIKKYTDIRIALRSAVRMKLSSDKVGKVIEFPTPWPSVINELQAPPAAYVYSKFKKTRMLKKLAIAASIILLFGIGTLLTWQLSRQPLHQKLFATYYANPLEPEREFISRSETQPLDTAAFEKFKQAILHMEKKQFKEAIVLLESITHTQDSELMDEVEWYLALCYLQTGKKDKAIDWFIQILNSSSIHSSAARNIYHELTSQ